MLTSVLVRFYDDPPIAGKRYLETSAGPITFDMIDVVKCKGRVRCEILPSLRERINTV